MEQEIRDEGGTARSQHVVHVMPRDNAAAADLIARALRRVEVASGELRTLVCAPSVEDALAVCAALARVVPQEGVGASPPLLVPVTTARRGRRLLQRLPHAVAGTPRDLVDLISHSFLKLGGVQLIFLLWLDELAHAEPANALETLLSEAPRDAERVATATSVGDAVERLLGRFMWRARRLTHTEPEVAAGSLVQYVSVVPPNRHVALRVLLDALDPESANVVTFTEEGEHEARQALRLLGYSADSPDVRVSRGPATETATLTVLFDEPTNAEALRRSTPTAGDIVVLVPPERVAHLRTMAGGAITPVTSSAAFQSARSAEEAIRDELRGVIRAGMIASQVLQLEPLCSEFDAVEVAAGALYLLQRERQRARRAAATAAAPRAEAATPTPPPGRFTRVYLNVGERDGARRGDIVGAITGEAGIVGAQIGKIDLRESHAIVEVSADIAARVIERLSGTSIRGRRVQAREDREQTGAPRRAREERSGDRSAPRRRPPGEHRGSRTEPREGIERMPRAARESDEWSARADRLRNARGAAADDAAVGGEPGEPR